MSDGRQKQTMELKAPVFGGQLELRHGRYRLTGRELHVGDRIEQLEEDLSWRAGLYRWTGRTNDTPMLEFDGAAPVAVAPDAILRWPRGESG